MSIHVTSRKKDSDPKNFLQYFWRETRIYWGFVAIFVLVFHVGGSIWSETSIHDLLPMYVLITAIALTFFVYHRKKWKQLKKSEDKIVIRSGK